MAQPPARTFEDLIVWQKAHQLVLSIYSLTEQFPKSETYGLSSQIRRAGVSVPANIAEGFKRRTKRDKSRMLNIAQASLEEVRYYIILANDLRYTKERDTMAPLQEVSRLLDAYNRRIRDSDS